MFQVINIQPLGGAVIDVRDVSQVGGKEVVGYFQPLLGLIILFRVQESRPP